LQEFIKLCVKVIRSIAKQLNINRETVRKILTECLDMRKVCTKMVPKELTHSHCL
jgi:energy-converting hydrogenase A subunit M